MSVGENGLVDGPPRVDIEIPLFAIESPCGQSDERASFHNCILHNLCSINSLLADTLLLIIRLINAAHRANITSGCIIQNMKYILSSVAILTIALCAYAQNDLQKMAETEREFEASAEMNGNKAAFIEYAAVDGL